MLLCVKIWSCADCLRFRELAYAPCRNRTCNRIVHYQLLTRPDSQIDSQKLRSDAMLIEFIRLWRHLDERTERALLVAACAYEIGGGAQMTTEELVKQVLQGILVLVGDYRGS